ncbi:hypothetical protein HDU99_009353, partial [Rhizoclosmatium hyalinum]
MVSSSSPPKEGSEASVLFLQISAVSASVVLVVSAAWLLSFGSTGQTSNSGVRSVDVSKRKVKKFKGKTGDGLCGSVGPVQCANHSGLLQLASVLSAWAVQSREHVFYELGDS